MIITEQEFANYIVYLNFIQKKLDKYFESQKPFIFCKKGCGKCCKNQQFPYTQIEIQYLILGAAQLQTEIRKVIEKNIDNIINNFEGFKKDNDAIKFRYDCPFLIDDICSVYNYRGFICRSFGLVINPPDKQIGVPFCYFDGMNYSNVIDRETMKFSKKMYEKLGLGEEYTPNIYNVDYKQLTSEVLAEGFGFKFGEVKPMINWLIDFKKETEKGGY